MKRTSKPASPRMPGSTGRKIELRKKPPPGIPAGKPYHSELKWDREGKPF